MRNKTIKSILEELSIPFTENHHNVRAGWIGVDCPFCASAPGKYYLGINTEGVYLNCWRCGPKRLVQTISALSGISYHKSLQVCEGLRRPKITPPAGVRGNYQPPKSAKIKRVHRNYLRKKRGFDPDEIVRLWGIEGTTHDSTLPWRILIPVEFRGRKVSWTTRAVTDIEPRYISARPEQESVPIRSVLYGIDYCRHSAVVTEGPTGVWRIGPGAVCSFGVGYTYEQINLLRNMAVRIICYDNEPDAQKRAKKLCDTLSVFPGITYNVVLDSPDPGSANPKEVRLLRKMLEGKV